MFLLLLLLAGTGFLAKGDLLNGQLWGISTSTWFWIAVGVPVLHQITVVLLWRAELHHHKLTESLGNQAFPVFKVIFTILFLARPVSLVLLGISNSGTLGMNPALAYAVAVILFLPFAYTMYSVVRYFGVNRAYGEDHFDPTSYRNKAFVKEGMFRFTSNAMYKFGFLGLWMIGFAFLSKAVLLAAAFNHLYIWVHFYFTELPDIRHIYGDPIKELA